MKIIKQTRTSKEQNNEHVSSEKKNDVKQQAQNPKKDILQKELNREFMEMIKPPTHSKIKEKEVITPIIKNYGFILFDLAARKELRFEKEPILNRETLDSKDELINKDAHAFISIMSQDNNYYLMNKDDAGNSWLVEIINDKLELKKNGHDVLRNGDIIKLGSTYYIFLLNTNDNKGEIV